ncbi:MAG: hypothetical protein HC904_05600 [Blastochloris sp.]|nr:hypothetical protein [Blastochloris sp.]
MERLSSKLTRRLDGIRTCQFGISAEDISKLDVDGDLFQDIVECLQSDEFADQQMALLFAETLLTPDSLNLDQARELIYATKQLAASKHGQVHGPALTILGNFQTQVPDYRRIMLDALHDEDPMARRQALVLYSSYCRSRETEPLESFESDTYMAEISMGGPLVYELRNLALETIESVIGKRFKKTEESEALSNGEVVYWWEWKSYHEWKRSWVKRLIG